MRQILQEFKELIDAWRRKSLIDVIKHMCRIWIFLLLELLPIKGAVMLDALLGLGFFNADIVEYAHTITRLSWEVVILYNGIALTVWLL